MAAPSSLPPVISEISGHRPGADGPARARTAAHTHPVAVTAARPGSTGNCGANPANSTTAAPSAAAHTSAPVRNRRTQSRAVVCGTSRRAATGRTPDTPAATASNASPITSTTSRRHINTNDGNNAWLVEHDPHAPRRTHTRTHRPPTRTDRSYPERNANGAEHPGHAWRGTATIRPAAAYSSTPNRQGHTMAMVRDTALDPPAVSAKLWGRVLRVRTKLNASSSPVPRPAA
jgi:hypothetical protein